MTAPNKSWVDELGPFLEDASTAPIEIKSATWSEKERSFEMTLSTTRIDRDNEIVEPKAFGEHIDDFRKNPVMLWSHDMFRPPIGRWPEVELRSESIEALGQMRPTGDDELADNLAKAVASGFLTTASIGFRAFEKLGPEHFDGGPKGPTRVVKAAMYEGSLVNIPSNIDAMVKMAQHLVGEAFGSQKGVQHVFAAPTNLQVIKRAAFLLSDVDEAFESEEMVAALEDLRRHVIKLRDGKTMDFDHAKDIRDLAAAVRDQRQSLTGDETDE